MARGINEVRLLGRLGADPELRRLASGDAVLNIGLATSERYTDRRGERREHTEWHTLVCYRGLAETIARYCRKGSQLYVEGRLRTRKWRDRHNIERYTTEILVEDLRILGGWRESPPTSAEPAEDPDDDIPF